MAPNFITIFLFVILCFSIKSNYSNIEDKYFFQLYPSLDDNTPYYFYALTNKNILTINATEGNNCDIIEQKDINEYTYKDLSSTLLIDDSYLVKTCFEPDILAEIVKDDQKYIYNKDLKNIIYCYSSKILNPSITLIHEDKYVIIIYFIENISVEKYSHKIILFYPETGTFSQEEYTLKSDSLFFSLDNYYPYNCITFRETDIFCYIYYESTEILEINSFMNNYVIETEQIFENENVFPVIGNYMIGGNIYKRAVSLNRQESTIINSNMKKGTKDIYLTECHEQENNIERTILRFSYYIGEVHLGYSRVDDDYGLIIENKNLNPNLINYLFSNQDEMVILYIKGESMKTLAISRIITSGIVYSYMGYAVNDYIRYNICSNPVYMQSIYINSFINYNSKDLRYMKNNPGRKYYKYERDIGVLISCQNENNSNSFQALKIEVPQCLNELDEINGNNLHKLNFINDNDEIIFDLYNDPNLYSFRDVSINFNASEVFNNLISMTVKQNGNFFYNAIEYDKKYKQITHIRFKKKAGLLRSSTFKLPYKLTAKTGDIISYTNQMKSNICYLEISVNNNNNQECKIDFCAVCKSPDICKICDPDIAGTSVDIDTSSETYGQCICDETLGFKKSPKEYNMCICKENYSFYNGINLCLKTSILELMPTYIDDIEEKSKINIYKDCPDGCQSCIQDEKGIPKCLDCLEGYSLKGNECSDKVDDCRTGEWFKLGKYVFNYILLGECVFIFQKSELFLISDKLTCTPFMTNSHYEYISNCLYNNSNINKTQFLDTENVIAYDPSSEGIIAEKYFENDKYYFHLLNFHNKKQISDSISSLELINFPSDLDLLLFKVDIKRDDTISTQVEYQFYNSIPNKIYQKKNLKELISENLETKLILPLSWSEEQLKKMNELEDIKIAFDSSHKFYLDVCYKFTNSENEDVYLEDRKKEYYMDVPFCEEKCSFDGFVEHDIFKAICTCNFKENPDNFNNVKFKSQEKNKKFEEVFIGPNIQSIKCAFHSSINKTLGKNAGIYLTLILLISFFGLFIYYMSKEKDLEKNNLEKLIKDLGYQTEEKKTIPPKDEETKVIKYNTQKIKNFPEKEKKNIAPFICKVEKHKNPDDITNNNSFYINNRTSNLEEEINNKQKLNNREKNEKSFVEKLGERRCKKSIDDYYSIDGINHNIRINENDKILSSQREEKPFLLLKENLKPYSKDAKEEKKVKRNIENKNSSKKDYSDDNKKENSNFQINFEISENNKSQTKEQKSSIHNNNNYSIDQVNISDIPKKVELKIISRNTNELNHDKKMDSSSDIETVKNIVSSFKSKDSNVISSSISPDTNTKEGQSQSISQPADPGKKSDNDILKYINAREFIVVDEEFEKIKNKEDDCCIFFCSMWCTNSTIYFAFIDKCNKYETKFIRFSLIILLISLYLFTNTLLIFNRSMVRLYYDFSAYFLVNILLSLLIINPIIILIRKYFTLKNIIYEVINFYKENKEKENIIDELRKKIDDYFTNKYSSKAIILYGVFSLIFLIFNCFLVICFCGIYPNSVVKLLLINTPLCILFTSCFTAIFYLIGILLRFKSIETHNESMYNISRLFFPFLLSCNTIKKIICSRKESSNPMEENHQENIN